MKWIGQHIYDLISRFRSDVYLEDISTGTIASGGNLGLDSNNKIVKAASTSHDSVTLAGTPDYITLSGQEITRNAIDLTADVTGVLPVANTAAKVTSIVAGDGIDVSGATGDVTVTAETATDSNPGVVELATTGESDTGTDTAKAVTPAGLKSHVDSRYSTSYITFSAKSTSSYGTNYVMIHANGISESTFSVDSSVDSAGDFGGVTTEEGGSGTDATATVASGNLEQQIPIPETCKLIGFYATTTTSTNTGAAYDTGVAIWHVPESGVNWGSSTASTATLIHKSDSSRHAENTAHSGANRKKVQKVERMDGTAKTLGAGDILIPSIFGETSNQQIMATITLVIATPIKTL